MLFLARIMILAKLNAQQNVLKRKIASLTPTQNLQTIQSLAIYFKMDLQGLQVLLEEIMVGPVSRNVTL